jgi:hypothetical protein
MLKKVAESGQRRHADEKKPAYAGLKKLLGVSLRDNSQAGLYRRNMKAA